MLRLHHTLTLLKTYSLISAGTLRALHCIQFCAGWRMNQWGGCALPSIPLLSSLSGWLCYKSKKGKGLQAARQTGEED